MGEGFTIGLAVGTVATLVLCMLVLGGFLFFRPWLRLFFASGRGSLFHVVGMRLRGSPVNLIIDAHLALLFSREESTLREVESQFIAHRHRIITSEDLIDRVREHRRHQKNATAKQANEEQATGQQAEAITRMKESTASTPSGSVPYGIDRKPMPQGEDLDKLLPQRVDGFRRDAIRAQNDDLHAGPIYTEYRDGDAEVWMELGICNSLAGAQQAIRTVQAEAADVTIATDAFSVGTEPSFLKIRVNNPRLHGKGVSISWSRGTYFFTAGTRQDSVLASFMRAFPY